VVGGHLQYSEKVMEYFKNPRNVGEISDADAVGTVGNPVCGDLMTMYLKVDPKDQRIQDIKFQTFGCGAAIATSSMMTELAKGKTLEEALKITKDDIANQLGGLPPIKMHCSVLATESFQAAVEDYKNRTKGTKSKQTVEHFVSALTGKLQMDPAELLKLQEEERKEVEEILKQQDEA